MKFVNTSGAWQPAPYYFSSTNIGTTKQKTATQGCFGLCVDFSGPNPILYATTMETGTAPVNNSQGNPNQNRLIRIVDSGNPGTNLVAQTLTTATTTNEVLRGVDFSPDLTPLITSEPVSYSTITGGSAPFNVVASSVYPLSYQWLQNGTNLVDQTNASLALSNLDTTFDQFTYQCVVTNLYGVVTSSPAGRLDGKSYGPASGHHQRGGQRLSLYQRPGDLRSHLADWHRAVHLSMVFRNFRIERRIEIYPIQPLLRSPSPTWRSPTTEVIIWWRVIRPVLPPIWWMCSR